MQALAAKPLEINFFQSLVVMALWLAAMSVAGVPAWPHGQTLWIVVASVLSTAGSLLFAWAYARGEASYLAVTEYSAFIWASVLGWLVFSERVSLYTLGGAALIVGMMMLVYWSLTGLGGLAGDDGKSDAALAAQAGVSDADVKALEKLLGN